MTVTSLILQYTVIEQLLLKLQIPKSFALSSKYTHEENEELKVLLSDWYITGTNQNYTEDQRAKMNASF